MDEPKTLVGWSEFVDLPDWAVENLRAKVDTGARNSALHAENVEEISRTRVRFEIVVSKRERRVPVETRIVRRGRVRSSTGHEETRIFVATTLRLAGIERRVEMSLVDRERMTFRMLLGRSALEGVFWVDPDRRRPDPRSGSRPRPTTQPRKRR